MNKNETRPTPETDAIRERVMDGNFDLDDHLRQQEKLERERDEAREELARMQTMAASVADVIAKRDAMSEAIAEFCKEQDWACDEWKRQPHIARLFKLNKKP